MMNQESRKAGKEAAKPGVAERLVFRGFLVFGFKLFPAFLLS
jgi:hypothetical protein